MASKVQLVGGRFQGIDGVPVANGYLTFTLLGDYRMGESVSVDGNQIGAGIEVRIDLDADGSLAPGQSIWANDQLTPAETYYRVTLYTVDGQPLWTDAKRITGDGGTFDIGEAWCSPFPGTNFIVV